MFKFTDDEIALIGEVVNKDNTDDYQAAARELVIMDVHNRCVTHTLSETIAIVDREIAKYA